MFKILEGAEADDRLYGMRVLFDWTGHWETTPYDKNSVKSAYHIREYDVWKMLQVGRHFVSALHHDGIPSSMGR